MGKGIKFKGILLVLVGPEFHRLTVYDSLRDLNYRRKRPPNVRSQKIDKRNNAAHADTDFFFRLKFKIRSICVDLRMGGGGGAKGE